MANRYSKLLGVLGSALRDAAPAEKSVLQSSKFVYPQQKALLTAQRNAALPVEQGGLGLDIFNTPSERASALGFTTDFNHGTQRLDRLLQKKSFDPKRATSGPMPYGTSDKQVASNYAAGKADTSRVASDTGDTRDYFQVSPKDLGLGGRTPYSVERSWSFLPQEVKKDILARAPRVGYQDFENAVGPLALHPEGVDATLSRAKWDWDMAHEAKGNPLSALRDMWHDSGEFVDDPSQLATVYRLAGYPHAIDQTAAPWTEAKGVFNGKVRMTNPLDTSNHDEILKSVIPRLKEAFAKDRTRAAPYGADSWDKNVHYTPKTWVSELEKDAAEGTNSFVWTSIPDKVTAQLKSLGYDGVLDTGGKTGGAGHQVVIPFEPNQVRSVNAAFDPKKKYDPDLLAGVVPVGALSQMRNEDLNDGAP